MADEKDDKEKDGAVAEAPAEEPKAEEKKDDALGGDLDLMDLFGDATEEVNEELAMLTEGLDEVDIDDLVDQVRDIQDILDARL